MKNKFIIKRNEDEWNSEKEKWVKSYSVYEKITKKRIFFNFTYLFSSVFVYFSIAFLTIGLYGYIGIKQFQLISVMYFIFSSSVNLFIYLIRENETVEEREIEEFRTRKGAEAFLAGYN